MFLELQGRRVKFFTDVRFQTIRDTLNAVMKQRAHSGVTTAGYY